MSSPIPRVALLVTGGTIDGIGRDRLDLAAYQETGLSLEQEALLARIPEAGRYASVHVEPPSRFRAPDLGMEGLAELARQARHIVDRPEVDGLVITRGTNSLEEFAYFAHLTLVTRKPVVFVGAMRPSSALSSDGDLNLLHAIQVAADPGSRGLGVLVILNDQVYSARDVTKTDTYRVNAFASRELGPLGFADADGRVVYYHRHTRRHTSSSRFDIRTIGALPRVDIVLSYVGADEVQIDAVVAAGARGIVAAGMGAGFPTAREVAALRHARSSGLAVCIASRVGGGRVVSRPAVLGHDLIAADNLVPWKARVLLALCLDAGLSTAAMRRAFAAY